jgi:glutaminyl-peptide cyclotransferase
VTFRIVLLYAAILLCVAAYSGQSSLPKLESIRPASANSVRLVATSASRGGFDAGRAYEHARRLVEFGPRPPGSDAIHKTQAYLTEQLKSFGCQVNEQEFHGPTPLGEIAMKNIVAVAPGTKPDIVLYASHYDTVRMPNFVGANDGASGPGVVLELARNFCARKNPYNVWLVFFDGEEAQGQWSDGNSIRWTKANSTMGSREMAARMALSGKLKHVKAMILVDMVGGRDPKLRPDSGSTPWLNDLIWMTAIRLGYGKVFSSEPQAVGDDDHYSFIKRGVAGCDLIDLRYAYWHTPQDTIDKVDPQSLAVVGHVLLECLPELNKRFQ